MLHSTNFQPTIENAPCPPFFVENIYDIFISTAENHGLTTNETLEVWNKCTLQYPYPTTTTTTTTVLTTTTTPKQTTKTSKQTTTTLKQTTTTPKQTTPKQTTKTTTPETATTVTTQKTTTKTKQTTTATQETTTTPKQTTGTTQTQSTISITEFRSSPLSTSTQNQTTTSPVTLTLSGKCDTVCLSLALVFSFCVLLGILIVLLYCNISRRRRKHVLKHSHRHTGKITNDKYIPKFPRISKQADLKGSHIAFVNPIFLTDNVHISDPFDDYSAEYQPNDNIYPWNQPGSDQFLDFSPSHYEVFMTSGGHHFLPEVEGNYEFSVMDRNPQRPAEIPNGHIRHHSICSHVPKMLPEKAEIYPLGIEIYDTISRNSGLPKLNLDYICTDEELNAEMREKRLPRIPLENDFISHVTNPYTKINNTISRKDHMDENFHNRKKDGRAVVHGLPRTPMDLEQLREESSEILSWQSGLTESDIDKIHENTYISDTRHGLPRTPLESSEIESEQFQLNKKRETTRKFCRD